MYRRNISHILGTLGICLVLFVLYHSWLKPQYLPPSLPKSTTKIPSTPDTPQVTQSEADPQPILETAPQEQRRLQRLIPSGDPPANRFADTLRTIHEELEKHNAAGAKARLETLPTEAMAVPEAKRYIASLWNNLGIEQERTGGTALATNAYQRAASLDPTNPVALLNLAHVYWAQRNPALTQEFLNKLIVLAPNEAFPHLALADLLQEKDQLTEATRHLEMASERAKNDPNLRSYLEAVTAKVKRTVKIEQKFSRQATEHFTVKYDGEDDQATWMTVLDILEDAYREIGQKFDYFPTRPIIVVLHTKESFQGATGSPAWADGLYDAVLGRIQIPTQGALTDKIWLTRVLRHEFVHALLQERMGTDAGLLPTWLNEGLAMQLAGDPWPDLDEVLRGLNAGEVRLIPLNLLEGGWGRFPGGLATVAYLEANSATHYLIDRFGMNTVRELLTSLKTRRGIGAAIQDKLFMPYDHFQHQWVDTLNANLSASKG